MNVLVLGGTVFYGRQLVRSLVARGHRVTTFNRGNHCVDRHLPVTRLIGDRTDPLDLARIPADGWDAVVDPSSNVPGIVDAAAQHLRRARRYVYVSSVSVYHLERGPITEASPVHTTHDGDPEADAAYGWRKFASEECVAAVFGERATRLRPGLIVGAFDPTDRFTYWPVRFARGGQVVVPGDPARYVQFIDARDVADFTIDAIERDIGGIFNCTSPRGKYTMRDLVDAARDAVDALPAAHWIAEDFLLAHGCEGWIDLPLWIPRESKYRALLDVDVSAALGAGLTYRPLAETIRDLRAWLAHSGHTITEAGLEPDRETEILNAWNAAISS